MAAERRLALHAALPDRYSHLEALTSTIDHRGRLAALVADPAQDLTSAPRYDATAVIRDGPGIREIPLSDLDLRATHIDTLDDGVTPSAFLNHHCSPAGFVRAIHSSAGILEMRE